MFMEEYKRLGKLCAEVLNDGRGVTAYIEAMQNIPQGAYMVRGWREDLKQLKHCRWIRNRIAHDPECTEANMSTPSDTKWIVNFHNRILRRNDPLALYYSAVQARHLQMPAKRSKGNADGTSLGSRLVGIGLAIFMIAMLVIIGVLTVMVIRKYR